jgi:hypothetical protein
MATKRPSYLKRQKEQKRTAKAQAKRDARRERKQAKASGVPIADQYSDMETGNIDASSRP